MGESRQALWTKLAELPKPRLADLFAGDPARLDKLATRLDLPGGNILFDWSKTHLDDAHVAAFLALAEACGFAQRREALLSGEIVNPTEHRAAEHTAQRGVGSEAAVAEAATFHARMAMLVGKRTKVVGDDAP